MLNAQAKTLTIFKTFVSSDAKVGRSAMKERLAAIGQDHLIKGDRDRNPKDALRLAIRDLFRGASSYTGPHGEPCKILISEAKQASADIRIEIHVKSEGSTVKFSSTLCSFELFAGRDVVFSVQDEEHCWKVLRAVGIHKVDAQLLLTEGQEMLYEYDLRSLVGKLIPTPDVNVWRGVSFAFGTEALEGIRQAQTLFQGLPAGRVNVSALTVENTPQNLAQVVEDITQAFRDRYQGILDKLKEVGPNLQALRKDYDGLLKAHAEMENQVGQSIGEECGVYTLAEAVDFLLTYKEKEEEGETK